MEVVHSVKNDEKSEEVVAQPYQTADMRVAA